MKKDSKKDKSSSASGTIEINEGKDGKYRFSVRNADGKYLGGSGVVGFASEKDAKEAMEEMKEILTTGKIVKGKAKSSKDKDK